MCRILFINNAPLSEDELEKVLFHLQTDNLDGTGLVVRNNGKLEASKSTEAINTFMLAEVLHGGMDEDTQMLVHFRNASSGGRNIYYTHPLAIGEHKDDWKTRDKEIFTNKSASAYLVHNGTLYEKYRPIYRVMAMLLSEMKGKKDTAGKFVHTNDTQLIREFIEGYGATNALEVLLEAQLGVIFYMHENENSDVIYKTNARDLFFVEWDRNQWMFISEIPLMFLRAIINDEIRIREVPEGVHYINILVDELFKDEPMSRKKIKRYFEIDAERLVSKHLEIYLPEKEGA